ncbi:MAG: MFS transporter [Terracidiphilus sp.]
MAEVGALQSTTEPKEKITGYMWTVLFICFAGYAFDALEMMLYSNALIDIKKEFNFNFLGSGWVMTLSFMGSAFGSIFWGPMADKIGRVKVMLLTVGGYAAFTGLTSFAWNGASLVVFRFIMGFFAGGEWAAGAALLGETWPKRYRGRVMGVMQTGWPIGAIMASIVYALVAPTWGWRRVFLVGIFPAVIIFLIRLTIKESNSFREKKETGSLAAWSGIYAPKYRKRTIMFTLLYLIGNIAFYCTMTWIPSMLRAERGMTMIASSAWFIVINVGGIVGYLSFGAVADRLGRRPAFTIYWLIAMIFTPIFANYVTANHLLMGALGFILGGSMGYFGGYAVYGAELWPTALRASGMGICVGIGRFGSTAGPLLVGIIADMTNLTTAMTIMSSIYLIIIIMIWSVGYETKGMSLEEIEVR